MPSGFNGDFDLRRFSQRAQTLIQGFKLRLRLHHHEGLKDDLSLLVDGGHAVAKLADVYSDVDVHFFICQLGCGDLRRSSQACG